MRAAVLRGKNCNAERYMHTVQPVFFIPALLTGNIDFFHFITTFTNLDLAWVGGGGGGGGGGRGSQGQCEAEPIGFHFSYIFHLIRMKFGVVMKHFAFNI